MMLFKPKRSRQHIKALIDQGLNKRESCSLDSQARSVSRYSLATVDHIREHQLHLAKRGADVLKIMDVIRDDH